MRYTIRARSVGKFFAAAGVVAILGVTGCDSSPAAKKPAAATKPVEDEATKIAKAIAELPEAERAAATAQKTCPVGDAPLGSMGMPYKVTVKGRDVYLCCAGCKDSIEKNPDEYLAKLGDQSKP